MFFSCCEWPYDEECPDVEYGPVSDTAKEFIPYQPGDSVFFKDKNTGELHYLTCKIRELKRDSFFFPDNYCDNKGFYDKWEELGTELLSNFPFYENTYAKINVRTDSRNNFYIDFESIDRITFKKTDDHFYYFHVFFNNNEEKLYIPTNMFSNYNIIYKDKLNINNKIYQNIAIVYKNNSIFYDTIYYNKKGILKLISSEYHHYLEIIESNI